MFDIGFGEMLLVAVVALVVLGPERLPGAARTVGALLRRLREGWNNVRSEVEQELQTEELRRQMKDAAQAVHQTGDVMRDTLRQASDGVREASDSLRDTVAGATNAPERCAASSHETPPSTAQASAGDGAVEGVRGDRHE